ncbi:hypothetical protein ACS386_12150 [Flavobacteriaceae bacterium LMO-SS05]
MTIPHNKNLKTPSHFLFYFMICFCFNLSAYAQDSPKEHDHDGHVHHTLHFSHPIATESPSPDTKVRLDYNYISLSESEGNLQHVRLEGEYAFSRSLSVEANIPYTFANIKGEANRSNLNSADIALKYANYSLEDKNILIGGGLEFALPTGNDKKGIGSSKVWEFEPYLDFGWKYHDLEIVSFLSFGIPIHGDEEEADWELGWNLSGLYHISPSIEVLLESSSEKVYGGEEDGFNTISLIPGIKWKPEGQDHLKMGLGMGFPVSSDKEYDSTAFFSLFYHL